GKASDDRSEGSILGYVTELKEEAGAARSKKDQSETEAGFFGSGKPSDDRSEGSILGYVTELKEEAGVARSKKDQSERGNSCLL
ncbi:MAG: hypothetical protein FWD21_00665, partial [Peptococcaceae bacterium]|nr:hypothetical protein [Peptococcaceae bacterium]